MRAVVYLALLPAVFCASISKRDSCGDFCFTLYDPVCGSNDKTYSNSCTFANAKCRDPSLYVKHKGACAGGLIGRDVNQCPVIFCAAIYAPVCGTDGKTYSSSCMLGAHNCNNGVKVQHNGPCYGDLVTS